MALWSNRCWRQRWGKKRLFRFVLLACSGKQAMSMWACAMTCPKRMQVAAEAPELQPPRTSLQNDVPAAEATSLASVSQCAHLPASQERSGEQERNGAS